MFLTSADHVLNALANHQGGTDRLRELLANGHFCVNSTNSSGLSPLKASIMHGMEDDVHAVLEAGAVITDEVIIFAETRYPHKPGIANILRVHRCRQAANAALDEIADAQPSQDPCDEEQRVE